MVNLTINGKLKALREAIEDKQEALETWQKEVTDLGRDIANREVQLEAYRFVGLEYDAAELEESKAQLEDILQQIERAKKEIDAFEQYAAQLRLEK